MSNAQVSAELPPRTAPWRAWRNVLAITLLGCLLFGLGCFVLLGKRSLTPVCVAHGIYNILGEPYLLMMMIAAMPH
jgi:hypothetical protein